MFAQRSSDVVSTATTSRLNLSTDQQQAVLEVARRALVGTVTRRSIELPTSGLDAVAGIPVLGAFVSVKRRGSLRSCCGFLGPQATLLEAVMRAAERTAVDDPRFPPVSPSELPFLDLEVWLLENMQPISAVGEARRNAVIVGRHGLHVERGPRRGLLLPGVAVEHELSAEQFLEQTCLKAGLERDAWKDRATQVSTFEGHVIRGPLAQSPDETFDAPQPLAELDVAALARHCTRNLQQIIAGGSQESDDRVAPELLINGLALSLLNRDGDDLLQVSRISLREPMPLAGAVYSLTDTLAQQVEQTTLRASDLSTMRVAVAVLADPALHGTAAEPDLRGLDPGRRLLLLKERGKTVGVYDRAQTADRLLAEAAAAIRLYTLSQATVLSLAVVASEPRLVVSNVPRPTRGSDIRPPAQAGRFYPRSAAELNELVDACLKGPPVEKRRWPAAMVPHAGLIYSGHIAGNVLRRIEIPSTVIVIGPKHTRYGVEWAVAPHQEWAIPGASLAADPELARRLAEAIPGLELDAAAHNQEHAIEVELPFLARLAPRTRVVGIALGMANWERCQQFARGLAQVIRTLAEPPLLLISSDMHHFADDAENRRLDEIALRAMETLDPQTLLETVTGLGITMCGVVPATIVMETLRQLGRLRRIERAGYATSGDTTGDRSRVVGYAGMLLGE